MVAGDALLHSGEDESVSLDQNLPTMERPAKPSGCDNRTVHRSKLLWRAPTVRHPFVAGRDDPGPGKRMAACGRNTYWTLHAARIRSMHRQRNGAFRETSGIFRRTSGRRVPFRELPHQAADPAGLASGAPASRAQIRVVPPLLRLGFTIRTAWSGHTALREAHPGGRPITIQAAANHW
jgi:hypothetical protein